MSERLDKYLSEHTDMSRSQAKKEIRAGRVRVNGIAAERGECKVGEMDEVCWGKQVIQGTKYQYVMLNKPAGVVSATKDNCDETVVEYIHRVSPIDECGDSFFLVKDLFPMGRLDRDTEGLLILTNDGTLAHKLLSPKNHVAKKYYVRLDTEVSCEELEPMAHGMDIGEKHLTKPAVIERISSHECYLTLTEGKFHQVKRMFAAIGKQVVYLKRMQIGGVCLDEELAVGQWRFMTSEEVRCLSDGERK